MRKIVRNNQECFWGSREHGAEFLGNGNSVKLNFGENLNLFLRNKGTTENYLQGTREHAPPPRPPPPAPPRPSPWEALNK